MHTFTLKVNLARGTETRVPSGSVRSKILQVGTARLTHECLVIFMAEVTAIINARPLTSISSDSEDPVVLTPAMLLTQKTSLAGAPAGDFVRRTFTNVNGDKYKPLPIPSGGGNNIYLLYK